MWRVEGRCGSRASVCTASLGEAPPLPPSSSRPGLELGGRQEHSVHPGLRQTRRGGRACRRRGQRATLGARDGTSHTAPPRTWARGPRSDAQGHVLAREPALGNICVMLQAWPQRKTETQLGRRGAAGRQRGRARQRALDTMGLDVTGAQDPAEADRTLQKFGRKHSLGKQTAPKTSGHRGPVPSQ